MLSLSPAKLLVILVIALIVLGPEKLPQMARQVGALWHDLRQWRGRIESEVRGTFPNLPPTHEVAQAVRSPLAFLDRLADEHQKGLTEDATAEAPPTGESEGGNNPSAPGAVPGATVPTNGSAGGGGAPTNGSAGNGTSPSVEPPAVADGAGTVVPRTFPVVPDDPSMN
jgi:sec-independent protein translocase protein TatB